MFGDVRYNPYLCIVDLVVMDHQRVDLVIGGERVDSNLLFKKKEIIYFPHTFGYVMGIVYVCGMRKFLKIVFFGYLITGVISYLSKKK